MIHTAEPARDTSSTRPAPTGFDPARPDDPIAAPARPRAPRWAWLADGGCLAFLGLVAGGVYFSRTPWAALANDAWWKTTQLFYGTLPPAIFSFQPYLYRLVGRPLRGLPWNFAHLFTQSVTGYTSFQFAFVLASAMLVYALARLLFPRQRAWAFAAAALKLVWTADHDVFVNHGLPNRFSETCFWLAACLLVALLRREWPIRAPVGLAICLAIATLIVVSMGGYETGWVVTMLAPIGLVHAVGRLPRSAAARGALGAWLGGGIFTIAWWIFDRFRYPQVNPQSVDDMPRGIELATTLGGRMLMAVKTSLLDGIWIPLSAIAERLSALPRDPRLWVPSDGRLTLLLLAAAAIVFDLLLRREADRGWRSREAGPVGPAAKRRAACGLLLVYGLLTIGLGVLLTSVRFDPEYGSRFLQWASSGAVMIALIPAIWTVGRFGTPGAIVGALYLSTLFISSYYYQDLLGGVVARTGESENRFWQELATKVPSVDEGTVVVMEDDPNPAVHASEEFSSFVFRALSETRTTFFLSQHNPQVVQSGGRTMIQVRTDVNFEPDPDPDGYLSIPPPQSWGEERDVLLDPERVIWVRWYPKSESLDVVRSRSAMWRLHPEGCSRFAHQLYARALGECKGT